MPNDCWNSCLAAVRPVAAAARPGPGTFCGRCWRRGRFLRGSGGGALAGGLAAILLGSKTGRQIGGEVLKLGGMAAVGALAYKAWNDWQAGKAPAPAAETARASRPLLPPPAGTPFNPVNEAGQQRLARHLLRAMIAAAKSDGHVDAQEQARIFGEMDKLDLSSEDKAFVMDELRAKLDIDAVADAASSPEEAAEIYAASLLAIDIDNAAERGYLAMLAALLSWTTRWSPICSRTLQRLAPTRRPPLSGSALCEPGGSSSSDLWLSKPLSELYVADGRRSAAVGVDPHRSQREGVAGFPFLHPLGKEIHVSHSATVAGWHIEVDACTTIELC